MDEDVIPLGDPSTWVTAEGKKPVNRSVRMSRQARIYESFQLSEGMNWPGATSAQDPRRLPQQRPPRQPGQRAPRSDERAQFGQAPERAEARSKQPDPQMDKPQPRGPAGNFLPDGQQPRHSTSNASSVESTIVSEQAAKLLAEQAGQKVRDSFTSLPVSLRVAELVGSW